MRGMSADKPQEFSSNRRLISSINKTDLVEGVRLVEEGQRCHPREEDTPPATTTDHEHNVRSKQ
jgi:hypothetical protein